ncbi:CHAT domain-containing protein [uncultured Desulfuromonas sp.]|uniref:CHAT domain-containing protein n=1 Tax=uncultured Desulfuromonas sp. TaxID=181013 RepID=UPI002AAC421D|nr:CHAT domain-containing protein [uncultured Desulfuromonas sp.]
MHAIINHFGADLLCRSEARPAEVRIPGEQALPALEDWASRYDAAVRRGGEEELLAIGRDMFNWIDSSGWASAWAKAPGPRFLELQIDDLGEPLAQALLDAPWELLASPASYLADDGVQIFEVVRRIGDKAGTIVPRHSDLQLMFMAAAPRGASVLNFEAEESAILDATSRLPLHLIVEESGAAEYLGERLHLDGPFEALHLSCHGDIDPQRGHVLVLEDETGKRADADANDIVKLLGDPERTPLVFLSACRTAEQAGKNNEDARRFEPFVRDLTRAGVANVLGWDGSVYDSDAAAFAQTFYCRLAEREPIPRAAAAARLELRRAQLKNPKCGRHWHLARLYLGPRGGGALAVRGLEKRKLAGAAYEEQFLDKERGEVPVAKRSEFVGRRRQAQDVIKAFRNGTTGVLIQGMGNLGKSSLAARIASRMSAHTTVVVFGVYDALTVFDRIVEALSPQQRAEIKATWRESIMADASTLSDALETLLDGPLDRHPILLIIDDLERILETPKQSNTPTPVQQRYRALLAAVLSGFEKARTDSRLLITSRYRFSLPDRSGGDLAKDLTCIPLQPMDNVEQVKQLRAAVWAENVPAEILLEEESTARALAAAGGNPGLQAVLMTPIFKGETEVANRAIEAIESFQLTGVPPEEIDKLIKAGEVKDESNAMVSFFQRMAFDTYRAALTPAQSKMLRVACLFSPELPIPCSALQAAGVAAEIANPETALQRLLDLGLFDDWDLLNETPHAAVNPLARPLVETLDEISACQLAETVLPALKQVWSDSAGNFSQDSRALELTRLALVAPQPEPDLLEQAANAASRYLFNSLHDAQRAQNTVLQPALAKLIALGTVPGSSLLLVAFDCAELLGDRGAQERVLKMMQESGAVGFDRGSVLLRQGNAKHRLGELDEAKHAFIEAAAAFQEAEEERDWAIARGQIADILMARGELDEALRIRTEEELPVNERLGDVHSKAVTQGQIADILMARGELDEALRIRTEEELPVYERLGDVCLKAVTQGKIADILMARGELDEALRIRTEEELPVYERLGDVRSKAVTQGKIADILMARGELDEALRICTEEELPVYERLGDVREKAVTQGKIADILMARGELDEALRIRTEEELPVYERLGDVHSKAVTQGQIADILMARGELDEALRIRTEEELPVYERLGDVRSKAVTQGKIADILMARGELDEALRICTEEELPVYERLGDVREKAVTQGKIADILMARGELDEALRIRTEEELPVYERLGDVHSKAVTQGQIADILMARGELDEALRIRTEEELPVYERLGDVCLKAVTQGKIADILMARGELDEALRIRTEEELPVYERLGDVRSKAVTQGKIADILMARGELDEALRIRTEEQLPVYERLGDVRSKAVTQGKIADILMARGELDEALALHEQRLPTAEKLEDIDSIAHIKYATASLRLQRGDHKTGGMQQIYEELSTAFNISLKLGRADAIGAIGQLLAQVLAMVGQRSAALEVLQPTQDAFEKIGNIKGLQHVRELREMIDRDMEEEE